MDAKQVARPRPVLVYDGDCGFCTTCVDLLERIGPDAEIVAWQLTDLAELGITAERAADAVQLVQIDGTVRSGHEGSPRCWAPQGGSGGLPDARFCCRGSPGSRPGPTG